MRTDKPVTEESPILKQEKERESRETRRQPEAPRKEQATDSSQEAAAE
jgi:hypothetical protein